MHATVQRTNLLVLQECLTHAGAEVQLPLQLADLFVPVTRALGKRQLRGPAQVLLSPRGPMLVRRMVQTPGLLLLRGLSFVRKWCISATCTREGCWGLQVATIARSGCITLIAMWQTSVKCSSFCFRLFYLP